MLAGATADATALAEKEPATLDTEFPVVVDIKVPRRSYQLIPTVNVLEVTLAAE
jgi:hypothetical protein